MEPLGPSIAITAQKYHLDNKLRRQLLGRIKNHQLLSKNQLTILSDYLGKKLSHMKAKLVGDLMKKRNYYLKHYFQKKKFNKMMKRFFARNNGDRGKEQLKAMKMKNEEIQNTPTDQYIPDNLPDSYLKGRKKRLGPKSRRERRLQLKQFIQIKKLSDKIINIIKQGDQEVAREEMKQELKEGSTKDNIYLQQEKFERKLKQSQTIRRKHTLDQEDRNARVEMGVEIYEKQINYIKIEQFKQVY